MTRRRTSQLALIAVLLSAVSGCATQSKNGSSSVRSHALRIGANRDVLRELKEYAAAHHLKAASVASAVGSLRQMNLRYANQSAGAKSQGFFEITSLSGVVTEDGAHLHLSAADGTGRTYGGHLLEENLIYTTLEIVLLEYPELEFSRELDPATGYKELVVRPR